MQISNWELCNVEFFIILGYVPIFTSEIQNKGWLESSSEIFTAAGNILFYKVTLDT